MQQRRTPGGSGGRDGRQGRDARDSRRRAASPGAGTGRTGTGRTPTGRGAGAGRAGAGRAGGARTGGARTAGADAARSATRPAAARRAAAGGAAKRTRAPQPRRLTARAAVLGMLLIGLLLAYAYPVRVYLSQEAEIDALRRSQAAQREHIDDLARQLAKWEDDEYVRAQARGRLLFVLPGEVPYVVLDDTVAARNPGAAPRADPAERAPWYGKLWSSVKAADEREAKP